MGIVVHIPRSALGAHSPAVAKPHEEEAVGGERQCAAVVIVVGMGDLEEDALLGDIGDGAVERELGEGPGAVESGIRYVYIRWWAKRKGDLMQSPFVLSGHQAANVQHR